MPELPVSQEVPAPADNNEAPTSTEGLVPSETPKTELNPNIEAAEEIETPLPPVLQPDAGSADIAPVTTSTEAPTNLVQKGARVSSLTNVALRTFADLQRKLATHYQKLREKVGVG